MLQAQREDAMAERDSVDILPSAMEPLSVIGQWMDDNKVFVDDKQGLRIPAPWCGGLHR